MPPFQGSHRPKPDPPECSVDLPRFGGHLSIVGIKARRGVHHGEDTATISAAVSGASSSPRTGLSEDGRSNCQRLGHRPSDVAQLGEAGRSEITGDAPTGSRRKSARRSGASGVRSASCGKSATSSEKPRPSLPRRRTRPRRRVRVRTAGEGRASHRHAVPHTGCLLQRALCRDARDRAADAAHIRDGPERAAGAL